MDFFPFSHRSLFFIPSLMNNHITPANFCGYSIFALNQQIFSIAFPPTFYWNNNEKHRLNEMTKKLLSSCGCAKKQDSYRWKTNRQGVLFIWWESHIEIKRWWDKPFRTTYPDPQMHLGANLECKIREQWISLYLTLCLHWSLLSLRYSFNETSAFYGAS